MSEQIYQPYPTRNTFMTSSPKWLITFTAMRPDHDLVNGRDVALCRVAQASSGSSDRQRRPGRMWPWRP